MVSGVTLLCAAPLLFEICRPYPEPARFARRNLSVAWSYSYSQNCVMFTNETPATIAKKIRFKKLNYVQDARVLNSRNIKIEPRICSENIAIYRPLFILRVFALDKYVHVVGCLPCDWRKSHISRYYQCESRDTNTRRTCSYQNANCRLLIVCYLGCTVRREP